MDFFEEKAVEIREIPMSKILKNEVLVEVKYRKYMILISIYMN